MSDIMQAKKFYLVTVLMLVALAGCTVGPVYSPPAVEIPTEWHSEPAADMQAESPDFFQWWEELNDPILNSLLTRAAEQNLDLSIAATRIIAARLEQKGGDASRLPRIDASAGYGHVQYNKAVLNKILDSCCHRRGTGNIDVFEVGFDAEWEIDLFGMQAHEIKALQAKTDAQVEEFYNIWVSLSAEIARNYIELRGLQKRLDVVKENVKIQSDTITLTKDLTKTGFTSTIDQKQSEEQLSILKAQEPLLYLSIQKVIHRLSILLGYAPGDLCAELSAAGNLPVLPCRKPIGIPSELLRRRPDIRKAERDLAAATEQVGSAVAALFPRLSLRGFIGDISTLNASSFTWFLGPQLLMPIFNSRMLEKDVELSKIQTQQALYEYQKTVLAALEEAENAIASLRYEEEHNKHLAAAEKASQEAYDLTLQLYQKGLKSYLEVLVADRSLLEAEDAYLQSQIELVYHYIALYKALGGGWDCSGLSEGCEYP